MTGFDPYAHDADRWGVSLAQNAELLLPCLELAGARTIYEVGAFAGDLTRVIAAWAAEHGAHVTAIDPAPQPGLEALEGITLDRRTSLAALPDLPQADAVVIDGDHNWWTVTEELRLIAAREPLPLLLFHDVGWPHARRDSYEAPEAIAPEDRPHPLVEGGGLFPGIEGIRPGGLPMRASADTEGGPRNGVLTAIEDFAAERPDLRLVIIPSFFGLGILWSRDAPYADALAELLDPWDRNPLLERLEANRVLHLASSHVHMVQAGQWQHRDHSKTELLKKLLISKSFEVAQRISRLRQRGEPAFSKAEVQALVDETAQARPL